MKRLGWLVLACSLFAGVASAQTATPISKFAWSQAGPDLATVQAYTVRRFDDGGTTGVTLTTVTCSGTVSPFQCEAPIPAYTQGAHTVFITSANVAGPSSGSNTLSFQMVLVPSTPTNFRLVFVVHEDGSITLG